MKFREQLHPSWQELLIDHLDLLDEIESRISDDQYLPAHPLVMRALTYDFRSAKVLILGQDPYPNPLHAMGLAFSVPANIQVLPPTLRNIFKELKADLQIEKGGDGNLSGWADQGVVLLNRTLTCRIGESNSHLAAGWRTFTQACVSALAESEVVAILWGANAQEVKDSFAEDRLITSPHPSPLSAYRGFFGSKPFTRANTELVKMGRDPINWSL